MNKTRTYYQPVHRAGNERGNLPEGLHSFQAFGGVGECRQWLENSGFDPESFSINEYHGEDIEGVTILDAYGYPEEINEKDSGKTDSLQERLARLRSDIIDAIHAAVGDKETDTDITIALDTDEGACDVSIRTIDCTDGDVTFLDEDDEEIKKRFISCDGLMTILDNINQR